MAKIRYYFLETIIVNRIKIKLQKSHFCQKYKIFLEGDGGVMSHELGHKKCSIKVSVMFCYLDGKNGPLSRFADVESDLGNFSKYRGIQQQPNIQLVFHKCWRKK